MNVLIIGSGAREHAMAVALQRSNQLAKLYCCGPALNPGIRQMVHDFWVGDINDNQAILEMAKTWHISLAIIGPEAPLANGLADLFWQNAIPTVGPRKALAQIETSKAYARNLMQRYNIPGSPKYRVFNDIKGAEAFIKELGETNYVVKANGLMSGKGVRVAPEQLPSIKDALAFCESILAQKQTFVIEEKLVGQEFSYMCFCDGERMIPMPLVQDHKRAHNDDKGPNTGGMGSYSDANHSLPFLNDEDIKTAWSINEAIMQALQEETKERYIGILYGSFIATSNGIYVIEFNARFGDPEAMNVLSILETDFLKICRALVTGSLMPNQVHFAHRATVCKYAVPEGYPDNGLKDAVIDISAVKNKSRLFLSSVYAKDGRIYTCGSRTAAYVGIADTIFAAEEMAEKEICAIAGPLFHRSDIGKEYIIQRRVDDMRLLRGL